MLRSKIFKIGKKLCFPDVPSTWVSRTVESILYNQDCFKRKPNLADPNGDSLAPPKNHDYEADEYSSCNPLSGCVNRSHIDDNEVKYIDLATTSPCMIPCPSNSPKDAHFWSRDNYDSVYNYLANDHMLQYEYFWLKKGDHFDVISLLSDGRHDAYLVRNNGDKVLVDSLRGKSILVCCVFVPSFWLFYNVSNTFRSLFTWHKHWDQKVVKHNYSAMEMVVVAKMRRNWCNDEDAFNHFFSGFPSSWLAIPFSESRLRDHVCNSIGLADYPKAVVVDNNHKVVLHEPDYGDNAFDIFPFCDPPDSSSWWEKYRQLDLILDLGSSYVFRTIDNSNKVSISELKEKVVGLYLCSDGSFIRTLDMISQECKVRNQEFEVVLVYLPYKEGVNPSLFQEAVNHVLNSLNITNWWVSPFDDFVSRRLWEAVYFSEEDELVILDPHKNNADPLAKSVLFCFGINAYPFTREFIVLRELEALRAVTLESMLVYGSRDHVLCIDDDNNTEVVPIAQLRGKNVILYVDRVERPVLRTYNKLLDWYNWIKSTRVADDFEVVFVSVTPFGSPKLLPMRMPWLVCPFDLQHTTFVSRKTLNSGYVGYTVPFGKDGRMIKLNGIDLLEKYEPEGFPPHHGLCGDIIRHFEDYYDLDMSDLFD